MSMVTPTYSVPLTGVPAVEYAQEDQTTAAPLGLRIILMIGVAMMLLVTNSRYFTAAETRLTQAVMILLFLATIVLGFLGRGWRIRLPAESACMFVFVFIAVLGIFQIEQPFVQYFKDSVGTLVKTVALYWLVVNIIRSRRDFLWMCFAYILVVMVMPVLAPEVFRARVVGATMERAGGISGDANSVALLGMICAFGSLCFMTVCSRRWLKLLCLTPIPLCLWLVYISGSRSGMLGTLLFAAMFYLIFIRGQLRERAAGARFGGMLIGFTILAVVFAFLASGPFWQRILLTLGFEQYTSAAAARSDLVRGRMAKAGLELFTHRPLLGWGFAMYRVHINRVDPGLIGRVSHNTWVEAAVGTGIVGVSVWFLAFVLLTRRAWKLRNNPQLPLVDRGIVSLCLVFLVFWWFRSMFFIHLGDTLLLPFLAGMTGYLVALTDVYGYRSDRDGAVWAPSGLPAVSYTAPGIGGYGR